MSRRIVYVFAVAGCAVFAFPASADRECFDNTCRMPEVIETPEPTAEAIVEPAVADPAPARNSQAAATAPQRVEPQSAAPRAASASAAVPERPAAASEAVRPQMVVDQLPRPALKPLPFAPHEPVRQPSLPATRQAEAPREPVDVSHRTYASAEPAHAARTYVQPQAAVIVVTPGYSYGGDGVVMAHKPHDPSWKLCQGEGGRREQTCSPYQYHAFGEHGYRPLGAYRAQRVAPAYVYVPDARIITIAE